MRDRTIVCPCEDVELHEVHEAIERGYASLETLKRSTAVTTGPCQGKWCLHATIQVLAEATDRDPEELGGITHRQPVRGVPLAALAAADEPGHDPETGGDGNGDVGDVADNTEDGTRTPEEPSDAADTQGQEDAA